MAAPIIVVGAHGGIREALARRMAGQDYPLFLTAQDKDLPPNNHETIKPRLH